MHTTSPCWSVAIFAARESADTLRSCIAATVAACAGHGATIDVLVNGNRALAAAVWGQAWEGDARVRVWLVAAGDKAHAWNEYLHRIWPQEGHAFFIDGYVQAKPDALRALHGRLDERRGQPLKTGGLHGNLHAVDASTMAALRRSGFRLPLGLYRTDSLIGAVLAFGLESTAESSAAAMRPMARERRARPRKPRPARQLIHDWLVEHPNLARPVFFKRPLCVQAARKLKTEHDWSALWARPELVGSAARY